MSRLELLDTSIVVEILEIPGHSQHVAQVNAELLEKHASGVRLHLPVAAVVESGDHVGRIKDGRARRRCAQRLETLIAATLAGKAPWSFAAARWDAELLSDLLRKRDGAADTTLVEGLSAQS